MVRKPSPDRIAGSGTAASSRLYRIQAIDRAVSVLNGFDFEEPELSVSEVAARTRLHKSTAHRILMALHHNGFIEQNEATGRYHLGLDLFRLGQLAVSRLKLPDVARPFLQELMEQTHETTHLAVLEGQEVLYVMTLEAANALHMPGRVGHRIPTYCTSLGKAMLSSMADEQVRAMFRGQRFHQYTPKTVKSVEALLRDLAAVRRRGWSLDNEEIETGLRCVGAAIRDHTGALAGAISVAGPSARLRPETIPELAALVKGKAAAISARLGYGKTAKVAALDAVGTS
jgi:DNA-binding IclR family transcriptional regulator